MEDYYAVLGVAREADEGDIKRAFREKAKRLHPDIAGAGEKAAAAMRRLLAAYETLSRPERRFEYDRALGRDSGKKGFDYRDFLRRRSDGASRAKLIFFDLLHLEEEEALEVWDGEGGLGFPLERFMEREDWMDCAFLLAEELEKRDRCYEAFRLYAAVTKAEREKPYFRHFMEEVETALKELTRLKLKAQVSPAIYAECLESLLALGFPPRDRARWMLALAEALFQEGGRREAGRLLKAAVKLSPALPGASRLRALLGG